MATGTSTLPGEALTTPTTTSSIPFHRTITTQFTHPTDESCAGFWKVTSNVPVSSGSDYDAPVYITSDHLQPDFYECQPSEYQDPAIFGRLAFSPGVCPHAWTYWDAHVGFFTSSASTANCCAPGFSFTIIESQEVFYGGKEALCVHEYTATDDFIGVVPTSLPDSLTSGIQVHDPWTVEWQASDLSILPSLVSDVPVDEDRDYDGVPWYDPETGETGRIDAAGATESSNNDGNEQEDENSGSRNEMQRFGYPLLGVFLGIVAVFGLTIWWCFGGVKTGADGKKTNRRDRRLARLRAQTNESQYSLGSVPTPDGQDPPPPPPPPMTGQTQTRREETQPEREATPPPPYAAEDTERWNASSDNPNRRRES